MLAHDKPRCDPTKTMDAHATTVHLHVHVALPQTSIIYSTRGLAYSAYYEPLWTNLHVYRKPEVAVHVHVHVRAGMRGGGGCTPVCIVICTGAVVRSSIRNRMKTHGCLQLGD